MSSEKMFCRWYLAIALTATAISAPTCSATATHSVQWSAISSGQALYHHAGGHQPYQEPWLEAQFNDLMTTPPQPPHQFSQPPPPPPVENGNLTLTHTTKLKLNTSYYSFVLILVSWENDEEFGAYVDAMTESASADMDSVLKAPVTSASVTEAISQRSEQSIAPTPVPLPALPSHAVAQSGQASIKRASPIMEVTVPPRKKQRIPLASINELKLKNPQA